jgi:RimJ/RimL family protein N-acetyltransferase
MNSENLVGEIVTLKILDKSYFQDYASMFSEKVKEFLHVQHDESEIEYLENRLENKSFFYCIFLNEKVDGKGKERRDISGKDTHLKFGDIDQNNKAGKLIGAIEIRELTESDGQLYSWINENYWGSGAYQEALKLISKKYFETCNLKNTCAGSIGCDNNGNFGSSSNGNVRCKYYTANVDAENLRSYYALKKFGFIDSGIKNGPYGPQYKLLLVNK